MAKQTNPRLAQQLIYQVFPRNHSTEGKFQGVINDLPRLKEMGVDVIYLLPIHPIGERNRKGDMGSPYAIKDYYAINPEYGKVEDFQELLNQIHRQGMKCMMDIVINHTAPDHVYTTSHSDYYYRKPSGATGNKVGDWTDIVDLDYQNEDLWVEMTNMLVYWAKFGVDGFRCDVASFVPLAFWQQARKAVSVINPDMIWLAESVHKEFLHYYRNQGYLAHSDSELFQVFDICYDYDIQPEWMDFLTGKSTIFDYAKSLLLQDSIYPANYIKLRFLENHDQPRIHQLTQDKNLTSNWLAFSFFQKGTAFLYAGQESWATHQPSLFTKDLINIADADVSYQKRIKKLSAIKHHPLIMHHIKYEVKAIHSNVMQVTYENEEELLVGLFRLVKSDEEPIVVDIEIPDGTYENQLSCTVVIVEDGKLMVDDAPIILSVKK